MFWNIPEVVEKLISLLDPASTWGLVQSGLLSKEILQKSLTSKAWHKIIKPISYDEYGVMEIEEVKYHVEILKMMELEEPSTLLLPLLHLVCNDYDTRFDAVRLNCTCCPEPSQVPQPTCSWKWVGVTLSFKVTIFSLQPSSMDNCDRAWPMGCLLDSSTPHETTCTVSLLFTHLSCR